MARSAWGPAGIVPHPLLYGLIMFARMLGRDARLVDLRPSAPGSLQVKAWGAVASGDFGVRR